MRIVVITFLLFTGSLCGANQKEEGTHMKQKRVRIEAQLGGKVEMLKGTRWPTLDNGDYQLTIAEEKPSEVLLRLPSNRTFTTDAKLVSFSQADGLIKYIDINPLPKVTPFPEAVAYVEKLTQKLEVKNKEQVKRKLEKWNEEPLRTNVFGNYDDYAVVLDVEREVHLRAVLKYHERSKGWFIALEFAHAPKVEGK